MTVVIICNLTITMLSFVDVHLFIQAASFLFRMESTEIARTKAAIEIVVTTVTIIIIIEVTAITKTTITVIAIAIVVNTLVNSAMA